MLIQMNQVSFKKLLIYSSIFQTSLICLVIIVSIIISLIYFLLYSFALFFLVYRLFKKRLNNLVEQDVKVDILILISLVSVAGIPPFLGFWPKWLLIKELSIEVFFEFSYFFHTSFKSLQSLCIFSSFIPIMNKDKKFL